MDQQLFSQLFFFFRPGRDRWGSESKRFVRLNMNGKYEYKQIQVKGSNNTDMNRQQNYESFKYLSSRFAGAL